MFKKQSAKAATVEIPPLLADPDYAGHFAKKTELAARRRKLDQEYNAIAERLRTTAPSDLPISAETYAALGESPPTDTIPGGRARLTEIDAERRAIGAAIAVVEGRLATARAAASKTTCKRLEPEWRRLVREFADAIQAAQRAGAALDSFRGELNTAGLAWTQHLYPFEAGRIVGNIHDQHSTINRWIAEAAAQDYINVKN